MNKRLIDGDNMRFDKWEEMKNFLLDGISYDGLPDEQRRAYSIAKRKMTELDEVDKRFNPPSDQGEAERLRVCIKEAMDREWELAGEPTPVYTILHQALSSHTEDADECEHEIVPYNDKWECAFCGKESDGGEADE